MIWQLQYYFSPSTGKSSYRIDLSPMGPGSRPSCGEFRSAWAYPALGVDDRGDIGGTLYFGGGGNFPIMTALIMDGLSPAQPPGAAWGVGGSGEGAGGGGAYFPPRRNISNGTTWVISGQTMEAGLVQAWYVWMGRSRDAPPTEMTSLGVQGTSPTSA